MPLITRDLSACPQASKRKPPVAPGNRLLDGLLGCQKGLRAIRAGSILSFLAVQPNRREASPVNGLLPGADPEMHAPQREAAMFYGMFLRGRSVEEIREEIDISPKLFQKWMRAREYGPGFRDDLRRMYVYRKQVLGIFESLVTSEKKTHDFLSQ